MTIGMIPARMGSQRLKKKNLRELAGIPLITRAIRKCVQSGIFDELWVNSENLEFRDIAESEGVDFHHRPEWLANNQATSEQFVAEFLEEHSCDFLVQVHSIAPLLSIEEIVSFVKKLEQSDADCLLSAEPVQIECAYKGEPINFTYNEKTNSQELEPVQRVSWSITGWRRSAYLEAFNSGNCATYSGKVEFHPISDLAAHVIKTEHDLKIAEALLPIIEKE